MMEVLLLAILIVGLSVVLLSIRFICGKKTFVSSHIDDNKALEDRGITCALEQDRKKRHQSGFRIKEHQSDQ